MKTIKLLKKLFLNHNIYFFTIDNIFRKIVIFSWKYILEFSLIDRWWSITKSKYFYFYLREFQDIDNIYKFLSIDSIDNFNKNISSIISLLIKNEEVIYNIFIEENLNFFKNTFIKIKSNKKILFILKWWWMEETIEKSFISFCNNSNLNLTVLYKFWIWYWWQKLNQDGFFNELKANNKNVNFLYNENFDDSYIDSIIDSNTEIFSFQYDYEGKFNNLNLIILSSVVDRKDIDCSRYKNIFSSYESEYIWYSTDMFINTENTNIYKIFNAQNINLLNNYSVITPVKNFILAWWMQWARDFTILNNLSWKYKWVLVSDEVFNIKNFLCMYRWIQSYYWFFASFVLSDFFIACDIEKFNNDDRSKMIATAICSWKPVVIPYHDWKIVKTVIDNKLWITYNINDMNDFVNKVRFFAENNNNVIEYWYRCKKYSEKNMDINKFISLIFEKSFN